MKTYRCYPHLFTLLTLILVGMFGRFLPHPPNFTPINAIAIFGAGAFGSLSLSISTVYLTMFLSDCILGFHSTMIFVYISLGVIVMLGRCIKKDHLITHLPVYLVSSSLIFFLISNFGSWVTDEIFYPKTVSGLMQCYLAAIPFLANQILGDLTYGLAFFACYFIAPKYLSPAYEG